VGADPFWPCSEYLGAPCVGTTTNAGAGMIPKRSLNVMEAEVARLLCLSSDSIVPVLFNVPRKVSDAPFTPFLYRTRVDFVVLSGVDVPRFP
jgi:hypothetical protein